MQTHLFHALLTNEKATYWVAFSFGKRRERFEQGTSGARRAAPLSSPGPDSQVFISIFKEGGH